MPVYKASILNKEISVNYEERQKSKLIEAIDEVNSKLESYNDQNGKISDSKLLSFLAIKLQAEILELSEDNKKDIKLSKKLEEKNTENINLNDKIQKLREQNELLINENNQFNQELIKIENQIKIIISLVKSTYED